MVTQLLIAGGILALGLVTGWALTERANEQKRSKEYLNAIARQRTIDAGQRQWQHEIERRQIQVRDRRTILRGRAS